MRACECGDGVLSCAVRLFWTLRIVCAGWGNQSAMGGVEIARGRNKTRIVLRISPSKVKVAFEPMQRVGSRCAGIASWQVGGRLRRAQGFMLRGSAKPVGAYRKQRCEQNRRPQLLGPKEATEKGCVA